MKLASVGDLPRKPSDRTGDTAVPRGAANAWSTIPGWAAKAARKLIADMEACARDFLQPLGVDHWKNNMGARPPGGPSDDQLKALADTANEIGRRTLKYGVRLSLHAHMWGPMEREPDFRRVMELTDPHYVYLILDTGHNVLGGMDVVKIDRRILPPHHRIPPERHLSRSGAATSRVPPRRCTARKASMPRSARAAAWISRASSR